MKSLALFGERSFDLNILVNGGAIMRPEDWRRRRETKHIITCDEMDRHRRGLKARLALHKLAPLLSLLT